MMAVMEMLRVGRELRRYDSERSAVRSGPSWVVCVVTLATETRAKRVPCSGGNQIQLVRARAAE